MKKFPTIKTVIAGSILAGLPAAGALAQPVVSLNVSGGNLGEVLHLEVAGSGGPLSLRIAGETIALPQGGDPVGAVQGLLNDLPQGNTGTPLDSLVNALPASPLPGLPGGDPVGTITGLIPAGGGGVPSLPVDPVGTLTGLIPSGGAPSLPALPVDPVGTITGLIPAGGGGVPSLPVDPVGTLTGLIPSGGAPSLPALPVDPVATVGDVLPGGSVPALPIDVVGTASGVLSAAGGAPSLPALPLDLPLP